MRSTSVPARQAKDGIPDPLGASQHAPARLHRTTGVPEKSRGEWAMVLLVFVLSCLYLLLFYQYTVLNANEGIILQGAERVLHGQVPYRDFFSFYTPGSYYWMVLLFKLFGDSILTARAALVVYGGILSVLIYLIARRVCSRWNAMIAVVPTLLVCLPNQFFVMHNWDSTLWAILALYCAVRWLEALTFQKPDDVAQSSPLLETLFGELSRRCRKARRRRYSVVTRHSSLWWWALATGSLTAVTCLFEQSKGAGLALGLAAAFLILILSDRGRFRIDRKSLAAVSLGFVWPFLVALAYFSARHALPQMAADLLWPFHHYSTADKLPYGWIEVDWHSIFRGSWVQCALSFLLVSPFFIICALPIFAVFVFLYFGLQQVAQSFPLLETLGLFCGFRTKSRRPRKARGLRYPPLARGEDGRPRSAGEPGEGSWPEPPGPVPNCRQESEARSYYVLVSAALSGLLLSTLATGRPDVIHIMFQVPLFSLVLAWGAEAAKTPFLRATKTFGIFYFLVSFGGLGLAILTASLSARYRIETRRGVLRTAAPYGAFRYIQDRTEPGEKILVYPYEPTYYYLTGTFSVSRHEWLLLGLHSPEQFREMAEELKTARPRVVLLDPSFAALVPALCPGISSSVLAATDPVIEYLFGHYRPCRTFAAAKQGWHIVFMLRNDLPCS